MIEHVIQQLAVELNADAIRLLERASNCDASEARATANDDVPSRDSSVDLEAPRRGSAEFAFHDR